MCHVPVEDRVPLREIPRVTVQAFPTLLMPVILLGCIYSGVTTPTEAAALAAAYAVVVSTVIYRSLTWREGYAAVLVSAKSSASIGMMIGGALVFNFVVTIENIPESLRALLEHWELSRLEFMLLVNVILLLLGCVLEGTAVLLIVVPVLIPTAQALDIDLVYFGVVVVVNIMLGLVTPPYGLLLFIMTNIFRRADEGYHPRLPSLPGLDGPVPRAHHGLPGACPLASAPCGLWQLNGSSQWHCTS